MQQNLLRTRRNFARSRYILGIEAIGNHMQLARVPWINLAPHLRRSIDVRNDCARLAKHARLQLTVPEALIVRSELIAQADAERIAKVGDPRQAIANISHQPGGNHAQRRIRREHDKLFTRIFPQQLMALRRRRKRPHDSDVSREGNLAHQQFLICLERFSLLTRTLPHFAQIVGKEDARRPRPASALMR